MTAGIYVRLVFEDVHEQKKYGGNGGRVLRHVDSDLYVCVDALFGTCNATGASAEGRRLLRPIDCWCNIYPT